MITGAASGIGLATVRRFAAEGARVVVVDLDTDAGEPLAPRRSDGAVRQVRRDRRRGGRGPVRAGGRHHGSVDVAFNNAGISPPEDDSILETGIEAWDGCRRST